MADARVSSVEAYGMQREMSLHAEPDAAGDPETSHSAPVFDAYTISGKLDADALHRAVELVLAGADVLLGRLVGRGPRARFVRTAQAAGVPITRADLRGYPEHVRENRLGYLLHHAWTGFRDLQNGPPASAVLVRLTEYEHVLAVNFDHTVSDHISLVGVYRLISATYDRLTEGAAADAGRMARSPSFFEFARAAEDDGEGRATATAFWRQAARVPPASFDFPGGKFRPWRDRTAVASPGKQLTRRELHELSIACARLETTPSHVFLAAITLVAAGVSETPFAPVGYLRGGRPISRTPVFGPLWETVPTCDVPEAHRDALGEWARAFATRNMAAPPLRGLALVDFVDLDNAVELRRLSLNTLRPTGTVPSARLRWKLLELHHIPEPPAHPVRGNRRNIQAHLSLHENGVYISLRHDPEDLPDGNRYLAALSHAVHLIACEPGIERARAASRVARKLEARP
ncbi:condensation domain-containing protein [Amycolatopsis japonica]|uniref:condensation domain-containing protein n=1 Tax=Amycolatopsis japonica TaxID=208439 RepID=UPI0036735F36